MTDTDLDTDECNGCTLNLIAELVLRWKLAEAWRWIDRFLAGNHKNIVLRG
jgi:hypothetical protein